MISYILDDKLHTKKVVIDKGEANNFALLEEDMSGCNIDHAKV